MSLARPMPDLPDIVFNKWAKDLNPKYVPMNETQSELFVMACMAEAMHQPLPPEQEKKLDEQFFIAVILKRIEAFNLPIKFSAPAKMAILGLVDRVGSAVILLIDCLNAYEGQTVNTGMLANLYPMGFYDEDTRDRYVDEYLKPRDRPDLKHPRVKWSEVYVETY
jgi:hypothetical protein